MTDDLQILVTRCLSGEQAAVSELFERYRVRVLAFCQRFLGQRQDAEDAAQETFVRLFRYLSKWDSTRDFEPWLMAIAGNRCRTSLAARRRRPAPQPLDDVPSHSHVHQQDERHLLEEVRKSLEGLRPDHREAFLLFHEQHLSYAEIAERLKCPVGTIKTWIHRARRDLFEQLQRREREVSANEPTPNSPATC